MTATCTGDPQPFTKSTESCKEATGSMNPRVFSAWDASELERKRMCQSEVLAQVLREWWGHHPQGCPRTVEVWH